jgi:hypothetical protein
MDTHSMDQAVKPIRRKYFGVIFDDYTPQVECQLLRDCLVLLEVARKSRYDEVVIVCDNDKPDKLLDSLGMRRVPTKTLTKEWLIYKTKPDWPEDPDDSRLVVQRDLYVKIKKIDLKVLKDTQTDGYYLPPQGRISPDTISLLRPAPNGYQPVDPALILIWT